MDLCSSEEPHSRTFNASAISLTMNKLIPLALLATLALGACTNPYDPGQRAVGGALIGGAGGAGVGALLGGGKGAAIGGLGGAALGAGTGYVTTPQPYHRY
jgi:hypothetical protein